MTETTEEENIRNAVAKERAEVLKEVEKIINNQTKYFAYGENEMILATDGNYIKLDKLKLQLKALSDNSQQKQVKPVSIKDTVRCATSELKGSLDNADANNHRKDKKLEHYHGSLDFPCDFCGRNCYNNFHLRLNGELMFVVCPDCIDKSVEKGKEKKKNEKM